MNNLNPLYENTIDFYSPEIVLPNAPEKYFIYVSMIDNKYKISLKPAFMKVKLIIRDVVMDELTVLVRGDSSGDGYVSAVDIADVIQLILYDNDDMFINLIHDYNKDNVITAIDYSITVDYIVNDINNLNQ